MAPSLMHMHRGNPNFDLQWRFLEHKIMNTMGMVYSQYWFGWIRYFYMAFLFHLVINNASLYVSKKAKAKIFVPPLLNSHLFDVQYFLVDHDS
jgi:hypothetical protein